MDPRKRGEPTPVEHETTPEMHDLAATLVANLDYDQHATDPATLDQEQTLGDSLHAILQHVESPDGTDAVTRDSGYVALSS